MGPSNGTQPLLSVCIPTYERAVALKRQLAWLAGELNGFEDLIEVVISDNASTDDTPTVMAEWAATWPSLSVTSRRNPVNLGWMRNFESCVRAARGRYCWLVGDDDTMYQGTLGVVVDQLRDDPDLALLYLNFISRHGETGELLGDRWFDPAVASWDPADGKAIFQHCIEYRLGAAIFISAAIFRTDLARDAIDAWPGSLDNWAGLAWWFGYAARKGNVRVLPDAYLECIIGVSQWAKDPSASFRTRHGDTPRLFAKLPELGYDRRFCARKIAKTVQQDLARDDDGRQYRREAAAAWRADRGGVLATVAGFGSALAGALGPHRDLLR